MNAEEIIEVRPVKHDDRDGRTPTEYTHEEVFIEDVDVDEVNVNGVEVERVDDYMISWNYTGKPTVFITQDGVFREKDIIERDAELQAYFALSVLDSHGWVARFRKA